ncbi:MAG: hypothetical protein JXL67_06165 [Calditrichaeota bacterium]|nr:hypothetical protein [Calditrichota bacterium]
MNESEGRKYVDQGYGTVYDPAEKKEIKQKPDKPLTDIPDDFPGKNHFLDAGITQMKDIRKMKDFDQIPGVGKSIGNKISDYLKENK